MDLVLPSFSVDALSMLGKILDVASRMQGQREFIKESAVGRQVMACLVSECESDLLSTTEDLMSDVMNRCCWRIVIFSHKHNRRSLATRAHLQHTLTCNTRSLAQIKSTKQRATLCSLFNNCTNATAKSNHHANHDNHLSHMALSNQVSINMPEK